jgi:hypothetical protein
VTAAAKTPDDTQLAPVVCRISTWAHVIEEYVSPRQVCVPLAPPGPPQPTTPAPQKGPVVPQTLSEARFR